MVVRALRIVGLVIVGYVVVAGSSPEPLAVAGSMVLVLLPSDLAGGRRVGVQPLIDLREARLRGLTL